MAEEEPYFSAEKQPHSIEPGAFTLDLYRLICMVSADRHVAKYALASAAIESLQDKYLRSEVTRIIISCATGLRILFDQTPRPSGKPPMIEQRSDCGTLYPNWAVDKKATEVLKLREACNKIIHATDIRFDVVVPHATTNPDHEGAYLKPFLYLYGSKSKQDWRAKLSIVDFAKWGSAAFLG
jgi:hypothetical protein